MKPSAARKNRSPHLAATGAKLAHPAESGAPSSSLLTRTSVRACTGIRANGERCRARASTGYDFCSFHRADLKDTLQAGRVRGGQQRRYEFATREEAVADQLSLRLDSRGGIQAGLDQLLRLAFTGEASPRYLGAVVRIYATALRNLERAELEDHTLGAYPVGLVANRRFQARARATRRMVRARNQQEYEAARDAFSKLIEQAMSDLPSESPEGLAGA